jgi:plastocyanin
MGRVRTAVVAAVAVLAALVVTVAAFGSSSKTAVAVTAGKPSELRFTLAKMSAPKGLISFKITNKGTLSHDFKIAGKTSTKLKPGKSTTLTVDIKKAGKYPFLCTVAGHAAGGMKGTFTVK